MSQAAADLDAAAIARLVPHAGRMCLLDAVLAYDATSIRARAPAAGPDHPLARAGRLSAIVTAELGLQAMALHGALIDGAAQTFGYVSSLTDLEVTQAWCGPGPFIATASLQSRSTQGFAYAFMVEQEGTLLQGTVEQEVTLLQGTAEQGSVCLVRGRATIMFPSA